jgi:ribosome-binding factor A
MPVCRYSETVNFAYLYPMSGSVRQQKFNKLVQKELSDIFLRDKRKIIENAFITITDVRISPDLGVAKIYVSMMLVKDKAGLLEKINLHKKEIRKALGDKMRNQARVIPELIFYVDETEENAAKMDALIENLNIPPAKEEKE